MDILNKYPNPLLPNINNKNNKHSVFLFIPSQVRYAALTVLQELHKKLAEDYLSLLPETIPFLAELMEGTYVTCIVWIDLHKYPFPLPDLALHLGGLKPLDTFGKHFRVSQLILKILIYKITILSKFRLNGSSESGENPPLWPNVSSLVSRKPNDLSLREP